MKRTLILSLLLLSLPVCAAREGPYVVDRVSDGDTIAIRKGSRRVLVRMVGVDAPEVDGPYRRAEKGGLEARQQMEQLLRSGKVFLEADAHQPSRDEHGRMLAYVYTPDGTDAGRELIRRGYARAYRKFRYSKKELFLRYEDEARRERRGLWLRGTP